MNDNQGPLTDSIVIARALDTRTDAGETTTLRQLHKLTPLTQSQALRALDALERDGLVKIDHALHDAWESGVTLTELYRAEQPRGSKSKA